MRIVIYLTAFVSFFLLSHCGGNNGDPTPSGHDRKPMLTNWVDNIIVPSYTNFKKEFDVMVGKSEAFTDSPNENTLSAFRSAWVNAYAEWQKVELFEFGPADKYTLRNFFNIYPADVAGIATGMADPNSSLDIPSTYPRQGFPALDYLLNGLADNDAAIVAQYTTDADAGKRLAYVIRITSRMNMLLEQVIAEWNSTYRETFINKTSLDIGSSTGNVVNAFVLHYERYIRSGKIGIPAGAMIIGSGTPLPEKVEAYYKKDISATLAKKAHQAAWDFFNGISITDGMEGPSLKSYLDALGAKDAANGTLLSEVINSQFAAIAAKLNLLSPNLSEQVQTENGKVVEVYTEMQKIIRMLKVDMTSAMSITITYTDNDGD